MGILLFPLVNLAVDDLEIFPRFDPITAPTEPDIEVSGPGGLLDGELSYSVDIHTDMDINRL
jgi:hypothetical protein